MKAYPVEYAEGEVFIEQALPVGHFPGSIGVQIAADGRVWVCIDGQAFIRFSPHPNKRMQK